MGAATLRLAPIVSNAIANGLSAGWCNAVDDPAVKATVRTDDLSETFSLRIERLFHGSIKVSSNKLERMIVGDDNLGAIQIVQHVAGH